MELASCQPSGAQNLDVAPKKVRFFPLQAQCGPEGG